MNSIDAAAVAVVYICEYFFHQPATAPQSFSYSLPPSQVLHEWEYSHYRLLPKAPVIDILR